MGDDRDHADGAEEDQHPNSSPGSPMPVHNPTTIDPSLFNIQQNPYGFNVHNNLTSQLACSAAPFALRQPAVHPSLNQNPAGSNIYGNRPEQFAYSAAPLVPCQPAANPSLNQDPLSYNAGSSFAQDSPLNRNTPVPFSSFDVDMRPSAAAPARSRARARRARGEARRNAAKPGAWTDDEERTLMRMRAQGRSWEDVAAAVNKSVSACQGKKWRLEGGDPKAYKNNCHRRGGRGGSGGGSAGGGGITA